MRKIGSEAAVLKHVKRHTNTLLGLPLTGDPMVKKLQQPNEVEDSHYVRNLKILQLSKNSNRNPGSIPNFIGRNKNVNGSKLFHTKLARDIRKRAEIAFNLAKIN